MINVNEPSQLIYLSKLDRCKTDPNRVYLLLLHSDYTKEIWLFKVRDYSQVQVRFCLEIEFPEEFQQGEYTFYLIGYDEFEDDFQTENIDTDYPAKTRFYTDRGAITNNGMYLLFNDKMLVTGLFKSRLAAGKGALTSNGYTLVSNQYVLPEEYPIGEIAREFTVLNTGLLRYRLEPKIQKDPFVEYKDEEENRYVQYKG